MEQPDEIKLYFWSCEVCNWTSEGTANEDDLEAIEACPMCGENVAIRSDFFET